MLPALETQSYVVTNDIILCSLLLSGNKRNWIETLTQCAEWSQFPVDYVLCNLT